MAKIPSKSERYKRIRRLHSQLTKKQIANLPKHLQKLAEADVDKSLQESKNLTTKGRSGTMESTKRQKASSAKGTSKTVSSKPKGVSDEKLKMRERQKQEKKIGIKRGTLYKRTK